MELAECTPKKKEEKEKMCDLLISAMQFERVQVLKSGRDNLVQKKKPT